METSSTNKGGATPLLAPFIKLSFDALIHIFEQLGDGDWRTPIRISAVCTLWRMAVLAAPGAWRALDATREEGLDKLLLFSKRIGRRGRLHVRLTTDQMRHLPSDLAEKLECISVDNIPSEVQNLCFPNVARLRVTGGGAGVNLDYLTKSSFPALFHLETNVTADPHWLGGYSCGITAPLRSLKLVEDCSSRFVWRTLVRSCRSSLVSLSVTIPLILTRHPVPITLELPQLQYLYVLTAQDPVLGIALHTPILTTYSQVDVFSIKRSLMHQELSSVTHLRLGALPVLSKIPKVRILQLEISPSDGRDFVEELHLNPRILPDLEAIEFNFIGGHRPRLSYMLRERIRERCPLLAVSGVEDWDPDFDVLDPCNRKNGICSSAPFQIERPYCNLTGWQNCAIVGPRWWTHFY